MINTRAKGLQAENDACNYLCEKGFVILARNYSASRNFQGGEIDVIARFKNTIHFVEVKARFTDNYGEGREAVTKSKQSTIRRLATKWLVQNGLYEEVYVSFDVIEITDGKIEHYDSCF